MDGWMGAAAGPRVQDPNHDSSLSRTFFKSLQVSESALVYVESPANALSVIRSGLAPNRA